MNQLLNQMRVAAAQQQGSKAQTRDGIISGYDPDRYAVKVRVQPEDTETGWIPLTSPYVGNGYGLVTGPALGDAVRVHFTEGSFESGNVETRHFNDVDRPPVAASGEVHLVHPSGNKVVLNNGSDIRIDHHTGSVVQVLEDSTINITHQSGSVVKLVPSGDVIVTTSTAAKITAQSVEITAPLTTVTGDLTVTGLTTIQNGLACSGGGAQTANFTGTIKATQDVIANTVSLVGHTHSDPQGGRTGGPA